MVNWRAEAIRAAILFGISVILVAGFWFHSEFYQLGLYPLLLVGGFVTFLVIVGIRFAVSTNLPHRRSSTTVSLSVEDGERLLRRRATLAILAVDTPLPTPGVTATALLETGGRIGTYCLKDAYRKRFGELTVQEARDAGYRDLTELRTAEERRGGWKPREIVLLARLEPVGGMSS